MNHEEIQPLIVTLPVAAKLLGVSRGRTIQALIDSGKLKTVQVNGRTRVSMTEIERLAAQGFDVRQS